MAKQTKSDSKARVQDGAGAGPELIDPMWILKALGFVVVLALVCGYLTLALLFWQGAWQIALHPTHTDATLKMPGVAVQPVRFAVDETGNARLSGYWIPAGTGKYAVLYLRGGDGQMGGDATDLRNLALLHDAGLSVLAFDYRGYGTSVKPHPTEALMTEDAALGLRFLNDERGVSADHVIVFGEGLGAVLAAKMGQTHPALAGLVLDQADADAEQRAKDDPRGRLLPTSLLLRDRFRLAEPLQAAPAAKLLIAMQPAVGMDQTANDRARTSAYAGASDPKMLATLRPAGDVPAQMNVVLTRFLDAWVPAARATTTLTPVVGTPASQ